MYIEEHRVLETFDCTNDAFFKSLFRSIEARNVVASFLSAVIGLDEEIFRKAEYIGGELVKKKIKEKSKTSDVIVKVDDKNRIIVEMNKYNTSNIFNKNSQYAFSLINETTKSSKEYTKVTLINIDNFNRYKTTRGILNFKMRDEEGHIETELYNSIHIILDNVVNQEYNQDIDERIINFCKFIKIKTITEMRNVYKGDENYMAAIRKVEDLSTDPDFVGYYDVEEAHRQELEDMRDTILEEGMEKGISQSRIEIAKNMLKEKIDVNTISRTTGLSKKQIDELETSKS